MIHRSGWGSVSRRKYLTMMAAAAIGGAVFVSAAQDQASAGPLGPEFVSDLIPDHTTLPVRVWFDETIDPGTVIPANCMVEETGTGLQHPVACSTNGAGQVIIMPSGTPWTPNTSYTITITTAVKDQLGRSLVTQYCRVAVI